MRSIERSDAAGGRVRPDVRSADHMDHCQDGQSMTDGRRDERRSVVVDTSRSSRMAPCRGGLDRGPERDPLRLHRGAHPPAARISSASAVDIIRRGKSDGVRITAAEAHAPSPCAHRGRPRYLRSKLQDESAAAHRGRPAGHHRRAARRAPSTASRPTTRRTPITRRIGNSISRRTGSSAWRRRLAVTLEVLTRQNIIQTGARGRFDGAPTRQNPAGCPPERLAPGAACGYLRLRSGRKMAL